MFDPNTIVTTLGVIGVAAIIFSESGLLIGLFLPGDSLLVTAGLLAAAGHINIWFLVVATTLAAIIGDSVGYATGKALGPRVFSKEESFFFKKAYIERTRLFFEKHGAWAIVLARFTPIIRTFAPVMAGVGLMHYKTFLKYNIIGGIVWAAGLSLLSYLAGIYIPGISAYIEYIIIAIVLTSFLPLITHALRKK